MPEISIILPVHDGERFLRQAIESVRSQTFAAWELILVDDASVDASPQLIGQACLSDPRIRAIRHEQNIRLPGALNSGFAAAGGRYLTWTSDDNIYRPTALAEMVALLEARQDIDIVYAGRTYIDENGMEKGFLPAEPPEVLVDHNPVGACFLYRRRVHEVLGGYDESLFLVEDYDFWLRASCHFKLHAFAEDLYLYRQHAASLSGTRRAEVLALTDKLLARRIPEIRWVSRLAQADALIAVAERFRRRGNVHMARRSILQALMLAPWHIIRSRQAAPVLALVVGYRLAHTLSTLGVTNITGKYKT